MLKCTDKKKKIKRCMEKDFDIKQVGEMRSFFKEKHILRQPES